MALGSAPLNLYFTSIKSSPSISFLSISSTPPVQLYIFPGSCFSPMEEENYSSIAYSIIEDCDRAANGSFEAKKTATVMGWTTPFSCTSSRVFLKKIATEFIGTFILLFGAAGTSIMEEKTNGKVTYIGVGGAAGLVVMLVILSTGHISGAHVNPAVTLAFAALNHFPWVQVPLYIGAQIAGSISASFVLKLIFNPYHQGGVTLPSGTMWQSLLVEFILTFILMFVVMAVSTDARAVGELSGIAVGVTVILNNLVAGAISGASMNPVRSLGPAIAANNYTGLWLYILGPISGALTGATAYTLIRLESTPRSERISSFKR